MTTNPTVMIVADSGAGYARTVMRGILRFVRERTDWECIQVLPPVPVGAAMREYRPFHGVIAVARTSAEVTTLENLNVPAVIVAGAIRSTRVAQVIADNAAVGRLAFEHLSTLGFRNYAFAGWPGTWLADVRGHAYARMVRESGHELHASLPASSGRRRRDQRILGRWLLSLPRRTAVFAVHDRMGRDLILAARNAGIAVPEYVAVMGVDNDELVCELTSPPLSSIDNSTSQIGYQAAAILRQLMEGGKKVDSPVIIPPAGVVTRQSTEILAVEHPRVVAALRYIRQFACEGGTIRDVLRHAPGSRRALERDFKRILGRTLKEEITRVQMERARHLLCTTNLSALDIAMQVAISSASQFSVIFKRETGRKPTEYRREFRNLNPHP